MKLMHLNIWQGRLLGNILKFIEAEQPDILCLQEVLDCDGEVKIPERMFNSLESIVEKLGYEHSFFSPAFSFDIAGTKAELGNAIISRYPLADQQTIFTEGAYISDVTATTYSNDIRNLQIARVELPTGSFQVANHHAHWEITPQGSAKSLESMNKVVAAIKSLSGPIILAGDMNVLAETETMQLFNGVLRNLTEESGATTTLSIIGKAVDVACDHILVNDNVQVKNFHVSDELVSDHKALILEFDLI